MYAIIQTGGKQYRVEPQDVLDVELLDHSDGDEFNFDQVLFVNDGQIPRVGTPHVEGAVVRGRLEGSVKGDKLTVFKFKKRKNQRRKKGHRQQYSRVRILEITQAV